MATHDYERPWQVMPAKIIKLALEHAEKDNDFDHQVAFLLLDIGVETALKTFLISKGHNVEKIFFPELLKKIKEELPANNPDIIHRIDDIGYFHGIRNKLYHQGDGMRPTDDNLRRYSELAKKVVEEVIEVNLQTEEKKYVATIEGFRREFEELVNAIETRFKYFQESCSIVAEKSRPAYATREFAMKLRFILENCPDREDDDPEDRIENRKCRLEEFNKLTNKNFTSHSFADYVLEDINHFYVIIALQQTNEKWRDIWDEYVNLDEQRSKLLSKWKYGIQFRQLTDEQINEEFVKIISWIEVQQNKINEWIDSHLENIKRDLGPFTFLDFQVI